jgi:hypothetical protein
MLRLLQMSHHVPILPAACVRAVQADKRPNKRKVAGSAGGHRDLHSERNKSERATRSWPNCDHLSPFRRVLHALKPAYLPRYHLSEFLERTAGNIARCECGANVGTRLDSVHLRGHKADQGGSVQDLPGKSRVRAR